MRAEAVRAMLAESGALREGHFRLSSGLHSAAYVQCALLLEDPARARRVGAALAAALRPVAPASILAPALGGIVIGHEVAGALGVPFRFAERHGEGMALRRGFVLRPGERVAIVEDVVTTGRSTREVQALALAAGAEVVGIGAILDRSGGRHGFDRPLHALLSLDLPTFPEECCPLCAEGKAIEKPGSRPGG
jgi:orotate phosphoribosyltransferase